MEAWERSVAAAKRAGDTLLALRTEADLTGTLLLSEAPVSEIVRRCEGLLEAARSTTDRGPVLMALASALVLDGQSARAGDLFAECLAIEHELGLEIWEAQDRILFAYTLLAVGELRTADEMLGAAEHIFERTGDRLGQPSAAALCALARCRLGCDEDIDRLLTAAQAAAPSDIAGQAQWRMAVAAAEKLRDGDREYAERLALEAVDRLETTEGPLEQAEAYVVLADVLAWQGRREPARAALLQARERYTRKGATAAVARVDRLVDEALDYPGSVHPRADA
ncbi:MAG: hypothetical protein ACR2H0_06550 [Candidatus Limnocylindrales bacterium]